MNIIIVGAGVVGSSLAEQLSEEGHHVAIIDQDRRLVADLGERMDVLATLGNGALPSVLEGVGIKTADMVIAVTSNDEVNVVVGMLANAYGVEHRIARIRNREYVKDDCVISVTDLGIDHVVNPEPFIVESLVRMLHLPGAYDYAALSGGQVEMFGFHLAEDSPAIGRSVAQLRELGDLNAFLILYITRDGVVRVPRGDDTIEKGDSVHLLVSPETVAFLLPIFHPHLGSTEHVIIAGASRIGIDLAVALQGHVKHIALIDADDQAVNEAAERLRRVHVLQGDPTDLGVLEEASIDRCDVFFSLGENDQENMLSALLAKKNGAKQTAVLVGQPQYVAILDSLGIDIVINPRLAVVGEILQHVRRGQILSVTRPAEGTGEIIEFEVPPGCDALKAPLKELKFPKNALLGAVLRGEGDEAQMAIPNGDTLLKAGERVLVYALSDAIVRIEKLFEQRHIK